MSTLKNIFGFLGSAQRPPEPHTEPKATIDPEARLLVLRSKAKGITSWAQLIRLCESNAELKTPAEAEQISETEAALGVTFPEDLRSFYSVTNGVNINYGAARIYSAGALKDENINVRTNEEWKKHHASFDKLLVFGESGNGDLWCFAVDEGKANGSRILEWDHDTDERSQVADSLRDFLLQIGAQILADPSTPSAP